MKRQRRHSGCTARLQLRLPPALKARLRDAAESEGITVGRLIVERLRASLERLQVDCAWCSKTISIGREPVSHGICPECASREMKEWKGTR